MFMEPFSYIWWHWMNCRGGVLELTALLLSCLQWQDKHASVHLRTKIAYLPYIWLGNQISLQHQIRAKKWLLLKLTGCMDHILTDNGTMLIWTLDHAPTCCRRMTREVKQHSDCTRLTQQQDWATYRQHRSCNDCSASDIYIYILT